MFINNNKPEASVGLQILVKELLCPVFTLKSEHLLHLKLVTIYEWSTAGNEKWIYKRLEKRKQVLGILSAGESDVRQQQFYNAVMYNNVMWFATQ